MWLRRDLILARYRGRDVPLPPVDELDLDSLLDSLRVPPVAPFAPESLPPIPDSVPDTIPPTSRPASGA
jgi:hypothetical protein